MKAEIAAEDSATVVSADCFFSMKKIRINELARELEVKAQEILDRLPELGVTEKKTHSSSIDEDVALKLRRIYGFPVPDGEGEYHDESPHEADADQDISSHEEPPAAGPSVPAVVAEPPSATP